ncbi:tyrosine- phosphatase yvh1 [Paramyrothecium foliicola]|nr:tyrosine- phosphatase yvh1 [Paramyrothecium foliicola]
MPFLLQAKDPTRRYFGFPIFKVHVPHAAEVDDSILGVLALSEKQPEEDAADSRPQVWEEYGHRFEPGELELLKSSIVEMALNRIEGQDELFVGGLWALRRADSLTERRITHVLSVVGFSPKDLKNFKDEPWSEYGKDFKHLIIDIDDVDDANLLIELPRAVRFIDEGLRGAGGAQPLANAPESTGGEATGLEGDMQGLGLTGKRGGVFVHCAAGKSRSVSVTIAYLLWRYPNRFDPNIVPTSVSDPSGPSSTSQPAGNRSRKDTAEEAVHAALTFIQRTRPMAEPNPGFMEQLGLWWAMGCPDDVESHPIYQRWAYKREIDEHLAVGQAPSRLRFEDEEMRQKPGNDGGLSLRCKKCRRTLAADPFIHDHKAQTQPEAANKGPSPQPCPHFFVEPLSWMRGELEKGSLNGRLLCPNARCGAAVGRYDWKGFKCACRAWVTPAFSLQRARVDDVVARPAGGAGAGAELRSMGIRMPPGAASRGGNL